MVHRSKGLLFAILLLLGGGLEWGESEDFIYKKRGRDPFWPLVTEDGKLVQGFGAVAIEEMYLEGIIWDPSGDSIAMINGMILREGDRIGDFLILKIENDRVTLQSGDDKRFLNLEENL